MHGLHCSCALANNADQAKRIETTSIRGRNVIEFNLRQRQAAEQNDKGKGALTIVDTFSSALSMYGKKRLDTQQIRSVYELLGVLTRHT